MLKLVAAGFALALPLPALASQPYAFAHTPGRLSKDIVPTDYALSLTPDLDRKQINGRETVQLRFAAASAIIQIDSADDTLSKVTLDGHPVKTVVTDNAQELTTITLAAPAPAGVHRLAFSYMGKLRDDVRGMFLQPFTLPDGQLSQLISSALEPTDARRMFPCWDEPAFRARFQLTITIPSAWQAISNMPVKARRVHGALATVSFERSPRIPTYLVHLTAGDFAHIEGANRGTKLGIWAIRGQEQSGTTALANARDILADYNDYFGYPFPLPKLDSIAIPGGFSGGMENWGAITYTQTALLATPSASLDDLQEIYSIQAHEMAHQWNGDLVTMAWWDDLWLNESFASFMAAHETDARNPTWLWWENQDEDKEQALESDAGALARPVHQSVPDEASATVSNDAVIIYSKGQAVLRMFEAYLGPDVFRDGVRRLMKARGFSNATSADLWNALSSASGKDMKSLADGWTEQAGFPLIEVKAECTADGTRTLNLTQQRFLNHGTDTSHAEWNVPLRLRIGRQGVPSSALFTGTTMHVSAGKCDEALSINADTIGYFRVRYDEPTLALDTREFAALPVTDRFALLDDQWALARSGREPLAHYLQLADAMGSTLDARAWTQIVDALNSLDADEMGTAGRAAFTAWARALLKPVADELGWVARAQDTPSIDQLRRKLLEALAQWGDPGVAQEARRRFALFLKDPTAISADDRPMIFNIVANSADQASFDQLHELARSASDPALMRQAYTALGKVSDAKLASEAALIALSDEIPPQQMHLPYTMLFALAHFNPQLAWQATSGTTRDIFALWGPESPGIVSHVIPQTFWQGASVTQLDAWLTKRVPPELANTKQNYLDWAQQRQQESDALRPAIDRYVQQHHGA